MHVKVIRSEIREGERNDGTSYVGCSAVVIFPDKKTAARLFIGDDVIDPDEVEAGQVYDMYRDEAGKYVLVFEKVKTEERRQ